MYSDLALYYLNQMGITPWVTKETQAGQPAQHSSIVKTPVKVAVFIASPLLDKERSLLNKIVSYLNVADSELNVNTVDVNLEKSELFIQLLQQNPLAILALGLDNHPLFLKFNCPVIFSFSPDYLLKNPLAKKNILKELHHINNLIQSAAGE
ncbi:MAG: DNA polymerase III subunit psi [Legionella sp.]|nr:DNA polymerase III subunit psi [Legionella sp.]